MHHIASIGWQSTLFADSLNRFDLLKLQPQWPCSGVSVRIHRNHGAEQVASALPPFLAFCGLSPDTWIGDYDDSLLLPPGQADAAVVWIDFDRYENLDDTALTDWVLGRLNGLRASDKSFIFVANAPWDSPRKGAINPALEAWAALTPRCSIIDLDAMTTRWGAAAFNERRKALTGTRLSDAICLEAARFVAFRLGALLSKAPIKVLALDLDNTLYSGVLGEDGPEGLELTPGHKALQEKLVALHHKGLLLMVCSKNDPADVTALFEARSDFPLRPEHISDWRVSWGDKAAGLAQAATALRLGLDSFLLVDDNLGELTFVNAQYPEVRLIFSGNGGEETRRALAYYPGLDDRAVTDTDRIRAGDTEANKVRESLAAAAVSPMDYLSSLDVHLELKLNPAYDRPRFAEMCVKTNQFNVALARLDEMQIDQYLTDPDRGAVMVYMRDRLSDSGSVGSLFARRDGDVLVVDELCISCRAMGRHLEDIMVAAAINGLLDVWRLSRVRFTHAVGPRNQPGREWLSRFTASDLGDGGGAGGPGMGAQRFRRPGGRGPGKR